jgi:hypothetical protein
MSENLKAIIEGRIKEWEDHLDDARYFGDSHYVQRCDAILTLLKNILKEADL